MPASSYQQQKLRVCEVCSAYLGIHDNDRRLADHFGGKLHLGFIKIREKLSELEVNQLRYFCFILSTFLFDRDHQINEKKRDVKLETAIEIENGRIDTERDIANNTSVVENQIDVRKGTVRDREIVKREIAKGIEERRNEVPKGRESIGVARTDRDRGVAIAIVDLIRDTPDPEAIGEEKERGIERIPMYIQSYNTARF